MNAFMAWVRPALAGLTTRGRSLLAAGLAAAACAVVLGQQDLLRVAILLIALPLGCALSLARTRYRLALTRTIAPPRVVAGGTARVRLELDNLTRLGTRVLLAEERVPYALGAPPRFVLDRLPGGRRAAVTYSLRSEVRGRYPVGPLRLRLTDPFGMCEMTRSFTAVDALVVVPRDLAAVHRRGGRALVGPRASRSPRSAAASGEDDVVDPGVPARRRPAPGALALDRAPGRADGAPRRAAAADARDGAAGHPGGRAPRRRARRPPSSGR